MLLACVDAAGGLGYQGGLPWHVPAELKHFKAFTMGKTLGVGRGTKLPPLPGRDVVLLSRTGVTVRDFLAKGGVIIGGATVFQEALPLVDTIVLSVLPDTYTCDCFFKIDPSFRLITTESRDGFQLLTFKRRK